MFKIPVDKIMKFRLISLNFVKKVVVLVNDSHRTKDFSKEPVVLLVVGEKEINGAAHVCGFVSKIGSKHIITLQMIHELKNNKDMLLQLDLDSRINQMRSMFGLPDLKIKKDFIVDRTLGDGTGPIQMFGKSVELWD